jgi:hypothetical protein
MTHCRAAPSMRGDVRAGEAPRGAELRLASVRLKLPKLWDRAASALAEGHEHLAGLALRRRQVLMHELESLAEMIASNRSDASLLSRIEAADRLLDASLSETSRKSQPLPREAVALDLDPRVQTDLRRLRRELRAENTTIHSDEGKGEA